MRSENYNLERGDVSMEHGVTSRATVLVHDQHCYILHAQLVKDI